MRDDYEDEYEDDDDAQGVGQLPDFDDGEDEDREEKHYTKGKKREEQLAMMGEN